MSKWFEVFVGLRYLRARAGNRFVSFISLISMLGIVIGVAVLIIVLSVMNGFEQELRARILDMAAHATLTGVGEGLEDWQTAATVAGDDPEVVAVAPFVEGQGMLVHEEALSAVIILGVVPEWESEVATLGEHLVAGELTALESGRYTTILGSELARELGVAVGDTVILVTPQGIVTPAGLVPRMRRFSVAGVFEAGMYEYDRSFAYVHFEDAQRLYRLGERASGVRLKLADLFAAPRVVRDIASRLGGGIYVSDWTRTHANFFRSIQITKRMMFFILLLIVAVAAFNIVSTLIMVVRDKQADIAILRTYGSSPGSIMTIFIVQGLAIGAVGVVGGLGLGALISLNLEALVHGLERLLDTQFLSAEVYYMSDLPARLLWADLVQICGVALMLALISTVYPAWRAARTRPAEVLRYE